MDIYEFEELFEVEKTVYSYLKLFWPAIALYPH